MKHLWKEKAKRQLEYNGKQYDYYNIQAMEEEGYDIQYMPYSIRVMLESVLRQWDDYSITDEHIQNLANFTKAVGEDAEVPFKPSRVILQDFTGVPAILDLASMRDAMGQERASVINPEVPVELVIDHSVQVDCFGSTDAVEQNKIKEFERNKERYQFLRWAKNAFENFVVVPPATGIVHQVNLEYLAKVVIAKEKNGVMEAFPDSLVGTDSHTTMVNALGVLGWGVGGIEAEAGMLGQPSYFPIPEVIGVRFVGELQLGVTATDLALLVTKTLRSHGVVGKFVEYFGEGMKKLPLADRATIANMAPEYGATCGFFPVDQETLEYLRLTGRNEEHIGFVEAYLKANHMFYDVAVEPKYSEVIEIDLSQVEPALAGPKRPQDLIPLSKMKESFELSLFAPLGNQGHGLSSEEINKSASYTFADGRKGTMETGAIAIAAITSCTNTSNPYVMLGAGLLAKKAVEKGLTVPAHVKTSLAPGSKVVSGYLEEGGYQTYLDQLGFHVVGYGCTTCIGNSGPLLPEITSAIQDNDLLVTSVLSGNRNFEGRIHPLVKANYLASPILVVAYALAGTVNIDLQNDSLGNDPEGNPVYLKDIWPSPQEINQAVTAFVKPDLFKKEYETFIDTNELWNAIEAGSGKLYQFDRDSTYIQKPHFFENLSAEPKDIEGLSGLRVLAKFGDSITTDHISPAGAIGKNTPAGKYLIERNVDIRDFNTYGSRRGNHEVMMRGTFANLRIRNQMAPGTEGGYTTYLPSNEVMSIYDACMQYEKDGTGLVVLAGKEYGMGSSRDWAAKGAYLLGVKAVIAESYERIHRSNLVMMGVLPLQFVEGQNATTLGLTGEEEMEINLTNNVKPRELLLVKAKKLDGTVVEFKALVRFDSLVDVDYYRNGGILQMVLRQKLV